MSVEADPDERIGDRERVDEPAALVADVDRGYRAHAEEALQKHATAGREMVGSGRGKHDSVDRGRLEPRRLERPEGRRQGQLGIGLALPDPATLLDPGAGPDPFVAGIHELGEVVVGHDALGHRETGPEEVRTGHA